MKLKFNLNFGGEQVRTIEDVRTQATNAREILSEIIKTFQENEETDPAYIEVDFSMFNYFDGGNKFRADFHPEKLSAKLDEALQQGSSKVIQEYFRGYEALVQDIIAHPDDLTYIYDRLDDMVANYLPLIEMNSVNLFNRLKKVSPLPAIALYGHSGILPFYEKTGLLYEFLMPRNYNHFAFSEIQYKLEKVLKRLSKYVKKFEAKDAYKQWHNIEPSGKKFLIFFVYSNNSNNEFTLASPENHDAAIEFNTDNHGDCKNIIFNGIDVKCRGTYGSPSFYYMEAR